MRFFLLSDGFSFAALFVSYVALRAGSSSLKPAEAPELSAGIAGGLTLLLVGASAAMVGARRAAGSGKSRTTLALLGGTAALGGLFCAGQVLEYRSLAAAGLAIGDSLYAGTFYALTGFHGLHVFAGAVAATAVAATVARRGAATFDSDRTSRTVAALGLYWHFVDAVWIVLFTSLYLW